MTRSRDNYFWLPRPYIIFKAEYFGGDDTVLLYIIRLQMRVTGPRERLRANGRRVSATTALCSLMRKESVLRNASTIWQAT